MKASVDLDATLNFLLEQYVQYLNIPMEIDLSKRPVEFGGYNIYLLARRVVDLKVSFL